MDIRSGERSVTFRSKEDALEFLALGRAGVEPELQAVYEAVKERMEKANE